MADAAVEFLLVNLKQLLVYNTNLISSIKDEVESLCDDLSLLKAFVKDTTENRSKHDTVKELVRQIRIQVYKAEDIIDMYVLDAYKQDQRGLFKKVIHSPEYVNRLRGVAQEIQKIRERVKGIYGNKFLPNEVFNKTETFVRSPPSVEEENVVGFDKDAENVVGYLKPDTMELEVITVVGMGGLGKTTLVKKVYNDPYARLEFTARSWVYVSQVCNTREVFLNILGDVTGEKKDTSQWSVQKIADEVRRRLQEVKYLIVLDDIWTKTAWNDLKTVFPNTKNGSRILITSRDRDVAIHAKTALPPYQLRFLTDDESWELLEKKVFPRGTRCSIHLEKLGKEIARKCYGLPLAIVVIAGILKNKGDVRSDWEEVEEKVSTYVAMEPEQCMEVLALSYNHLPYDLKACFLYFGVFPEDFEIPVRKLIHIWVDEGFVQSFGDASVEEMAKKNLMNLVGRNLVLVEKRRANGGIKTCRVHDLLHDMCVKQAKEEDFFKEIKGSQSSSDRYVGSNLNRRVSVHSRVLDYISSKSDSSHVRSFLCYGNEETELPLKQVKCFPDSFKLLRVLDVLPISFPRFPSIQLFHLRYIALQGQFKAIPGAISKLWNLQTLIVETSFRNIDVQADIWKLLRLRHVYTSAASKLPTPSSKAPLVSENLRTMSKVSPDSCTDVILARTPNLQKLSVRGKLSLLLEKKNGTSKFNNIAKLSHLEKLKLLNDTCPDPPLKLDGLPSFTQFPPKLKKLTLSDTMLAWEEMSVLGKLPFLEVLKLGDNAFMGDVWVTSDGGFVHLRVLQIGQTDLKEWKAAGHQFPQLQRVSLKHCEQLVRVPLGLTDISTLDVMELSWCSSLAVRSVRSIEKKFKLLVFPHDQETET